MVDNQFVNGMNALLKKVKEILVAQLKECIQLITEWEQRFITTHGIHPNPEDIPDITANAMRRKRRLSNILYHEWKLTITVISSSSVYKL